MLRLFGVSESAVARALEEAGGDGEGVEATICAREFEIHVDLVVDSGMEERADVLEAGLTDHLEQWLFARDERPMIRRLEISGRYPILQPSQQTRENPMIAVESAERDGSPSIGQVVWSWSRFSDT